MKHPVNFDIREHPNDLRDVLPRPFRYMPHVAMLVCFGMLITGFYLRGNSVTAELKRRGLEAETQVSLAEVKKTNSAIAIMQAREKSARSKAAWQETVLPLAPLVHSVFVAERWKDDGIPGVPNEFREALSAAAKGKVALDLLELVRTGNNVEMTMIGAQNAVLNRDVGRAWFRIASQYLEVNQGFKASAIKEPAITDGWSYQGTFVKPTTTTPKRR